MAATKKEQTPLQWVMGQGAKLGMAVVLLALLVLAQFNFDSLLAEARKEFLKELKEARDYDSEQRSKIWQFVREELASLKAALLSRNP